MQTIKNIIYLRYIMTEVELVTGKLLCISPTPITTIPKVYTILSDCHVYSHPANNQLPNVSSFAEREDVKRDEQYHLSEITEM